MRADGHTEEAVTGQSAGIDPVADEVVVFQQVLLDVAGLDAGFQRVDHDEVVG